MTRPYDIDEEFICRSHVEAVCRNIALVCGGISFTDWVMVVKLYGGKKKRLSDDVIYDLKYDNTLPESFDNLEQFRAYLRSWHACPVAMQLTRPVWKRYMRMGLRGGQDHDQQPNP